MRITFAWHIQAVLLARRGLIHVLLALLLLQVGGGLGAVGVCIALFDDFVGGAGANIICLCSLVVMLVVLIARINVG